MVVNQKPVPVEITFIDFTCPHCGGPVSFPEQWIGRAQECPTCFQILIVPKPGVQVGAKLPIPIRTSRLLLRRLTPLDSNDLLEIVSDEDLLQFQDWYPMDDEEVQSWLEEDQKKQLFQTGPAFHLALELLEQPKVIGYVALTYLEKDNSEMSVDILVNHKYQRRGLGTEAFRGVMEFIFEGLNVRRICCWCDSRNLAGMCLLEKAGLRREGRVRRLRLSSTLSETMRFAQKAVIRCL